MKQIEAFVLARDGGTRTCKLTTIPASTHKRLPTRFRPLRDRALLALKYPLVLMLTFDDKAYFPSALRTLVTITPT